MAKNLKLKAARVQLDLSQEALAERIGISRQTVHLIERGDYNPSLRLCLHWARPWMSCFGVRRGQNELEVELV